MIVKFSEFKGKPVLQVWDDETAKTPLFACGFRKAKIILEHVDDIRRFVQSQVVEEGAKTE